jgi:beta-glucoside PTS system EIICBA component
MPDDKYQITASQILKELGGAENVAGVTYCITRLRLSLKDPALANLENIKKVNGVAGVIKSAGQIHVVIGAEVRKVYQEFVSLGDFPSGDAPQESSGAPKAKLSWAGVGKGILDYLSGSLTPLIPILLAASLFKMLAAVLGPTMLKVLAPDSDLLTLFTFVGDAGFYFFPLMIGYTAAKKLNMSPVLGMFMGAIFVHPTLAGMVGKRDFFPVFGIPAHVQNYASTILPILLSIWVMSYVDRFFNRIVPATFKALFAPFLTILVMLPVALAVLGPAGYFAGDAICKGILAMNGLAGILGIALVGMLWEYLVMSGMHWVLITTLITVFSQNGSESFVSPAALAASFSVAGMCLGAALRIRDKEQKGLSYGYFIASIIGGVTEPGLYGLGIRFRRPFIGMMAGGLAGSIYASLAHVTAYNLIPVASFISLLGYAGGSAMNLVNGIIAAALSVIAAAICTYLWGFKKDDPLLAKAK